MSIHGKGLNYSDLLLIQKVETLREALTRIVKHLETLDDPSATISSIAEEALKNTE